jgi:hypothetical protein
MLNSNASLRAQGLAASKVEMLWKHGPAHAMMQPAFVQVPAKGKCLSSGQ